MKTEYSLKNFRLFDSAGASFRMTPITILTGCNSSGKSSVVKSMVLLKECIERASERFRLEGKYNPFECYVDFSSKGLNLKSFSSVVNRNAENKEIVISYSTRGMIYPYTIEITFSERDNDFFDHGWISAMKVFSSWNRELVLDVSFEKNKPKIHTLNMNNVYLCLEFEATCYASTLYMIDEKIRECYSIYGDLEDEDEYKQLMKRREGLLKTVEESHGSIKNEVSIAYSYLKNHEISSKYKKSFFQDYERPLHHLTYDRVMLYFPVLEHFRGISKKEVRGVLLGAKQDEFFDQLDSTAFYDDAVAIADAFDASRYDSFIDYYRNIENEEFFNVANSQKMDYHMLEFDNDFIGAISDIVAMIRFDNNNPIHMLSSYAKGDVNLNVLYRFLSKWQFYERNSDEYIVGTFDHGLVQSYHILYGCFCNYLSFLLEKVLRPDLFKRLKYIGNFQSDVKRLYNFDDHNNDLGNTIKEYLFNKSRVEALYKNHSFYHRHSEARIYKPGAFTNKWVNRLGLGSALRIVEDEDGIGAKLYLIKKNGRSKSYPLADEGYGVSQLVTFLLHIENEILLDKILSDPYQKMIDDRQGNTVQRATPTLAIEEPEVSLHPSMQSLLADVFYDAYKSFDIHFIVETHSEYLIRRTQAIVAGYKNKDEFDKRPFCVHYIGRQGKAYEMEYTVSGRFNNSFGDGFFDEASRSSLQVLKRERRMRHE